MGTRMRKKTYTTRALILRTHDLGEADRIIVLATPDRGLVRAVARGVRRPGSRLGARVEPFMLADLQLAEGRFLHTIQQAVLVAPYGVELVKDLTSLQVASALVELTQELDRGLLPDGLYALLLGAVAALARRAYPPLAVYDSFAIRALSLAGWDMAVDACAVTGSTHRLTGFSSRHGGVVSADSGIGAGVAHLLPKTAEVLSWLKSSQWEAIRSAPEPALRQAHALTQDFLGWHLEKRLSTMAPFEAARTERP